MCEPVSISTTTLAIMGGMATLSAASSAMAIYQTNQNAKAQVQAATEAAKADLQAVQDQRAELDQYYSGEAMDVQRQYLQQQATLRVAQGESGLVGNTPFRELANLRLKTGEQIGTLEANRAAGIRQGAREESKILAAHRGRTADAMSKYTGGLAAGLQIGGAAIGGAAQGYQLGNALSPSVKNLPKNKYDWKKQGNWGPE